MRRVAVKIAYLGEDFAGSQIQPGMRTVEGDVMSDLKRIGNLDDEIVNLKCASRTDRGVNALGNVVVFNTSFDDDAVLLKALNAVSKGVFYLSIADVNEEFNPRHANERVYRYMLPAEGLDAKTVRRCASLFEGTHDLVRFCKPDGRSTEIDMRSVKVRRSGDVFAIEFRAEYFLWNLIRRIVAAIASVGRGDSAMDEVKRALNGEEISFGIARADALTLVDVIYNDIEFNVPAASDAIALRAKDELFRLALKRTFFGSL